MPPGFDVELRLGPLEVFRVRDPLVLSEQPSGSGSHLKIGDGYGVIGQDLLQEGDHNRSAATAPLRAGMRQITAHSSTRAAGCE